MKDTDKIKKKIFDLKDPVDRAFSLFEVINTVDVVKKVDPRALGPVKKS